MIVPSVGRIVWYHGASTLKPQQQPFAAIITYVHSDSLINIAYFDENGRANSATSIHLVQEGFEALTGIHCQWMPYQQAVAKGEIPPVLHATGEEK